MRVAVFGYHDVGCAGLEVVLEAGHEVVAVYTHEDDPAEPRWFRSLAELARSRGLPVEHPADVNAPGCVAAVRRARPDAILSLYYRNLLGSELLGIPPRGAFNLHGSLLPRYRGRCPLNWALIHGERETGVTLHHMVERADAGDIVGQRRIAIADDETAPELHGKLVAAARDLLADLLPAIASGRSPRTPQDLAAGSYFGRRRPEDGRIDWSRPARRIHDLVRGVTRPWPGAFTSHGPGGPRLNVWRSAVEADGGCAAAPGTLLGIDPLRVAAGAGVLRLLDWQIAADGAALAPGVRLG